MLRRVTTKSVVFPKPFVIDPIDGELLPGIYTVETEEESLDTLSVLAFRRVSTTIHVCTNGVTSVITVDPAVLDAALRPNLGVVD